MSVCPEAQAAISPKGQIVHVYSRKGRASILSSSATNLEGKTWMSDKLVCLFLIYNFCNFVF